MSETITCPKGSDLQRLLLGLIPDAEAIEVARHVRECGKCLDALQTLDADDTLVINLRQKAINPKPAVAPLLQAVSNSEVNLPPDLTETISAGPPVPAPPRGDASQTDVPSGRALAAPAPGDPGQTWLALLAPAQAPGELGRLGPYRILKVIGTGATGVVFQAEDQQLRRTVALKAMKPEVGGTEVARQRFLREARAAAALEHENIVTMYQVGEDRGVPYLAMQLLKGETLDDRLKREGKLPIAEAMRIAREIAAGLSAAHAQGLVHRDIKPANIWLEKARGRVRIVDFGLARAASDDTHLTRTGTIVGTPAYMPPEQAKGAAVDFRSDLFSLGAVIYRMVAGRTPFQAEDTMAMLLALAYEQPPPLQSLNPDAPQTLLVLINRLLAKLPEGRPDSTQVVVEALEIIERECAGTTAAAADAKAARPTLGRRLRTAALLVGVAALVMGGYFATPEVMRVASNRGVVTVSAAESDMALVIKRNGQLVQSRTTNRRFELPPGQYEVELANPKPGWTVSPKTFTLERGGKVAVQLNVERVPSGK